MAEPLATGTRVRYHGSLKDRVTFRSGAGEEDATLHMGDVEFIVGRAYREPYPDDESSSVDGWRYYLDPADPNVLVGDRKSNYLWNVRRQSFTIAEGVN
jgi:hypothetical protein